MKPILVTLVLAAALFINSCQKPFTDYSVENVYDADVQKFVDSAGTLNDVQKAAVNNFVVQLKTSSLWGKFTAIYPMMGGTEQSVKWNLKDPGNSDADFRLTMHGSPVYSDSGVLFPTIADYADTHVLDNMLPYNNNAVAYFSSTQNTVSGYDIGCVDNAAPYNELAIYHRTDASDWFGFYQFGYAPAVTTGLFIFSSDTADVKRYDNGVLTKAKGSAPVDLYNGKPILIGTVAAASSGGQRQCQLATIGYSLSDSNVVEFCKIARTFQASMGR